MPSAFDTTALNNDGEPFWKLGVMQGEMPFEANAQDISAIPATQPLFPDLPSEFFSVSEASIYDSMKIGDGSRDFHPVPSNLSSGIVMKDRILGGSPSTSSNIGPAAAKLSSFAFPDFNGLRKSGVITRIDSVSRYALTNTYFQRPFG